MKTILVIIAGLLLAFFQPVIGAIAGVLMVIFNQQLDPNGGSSGMFNFQGIGWLLGGGILTVMSALVIAVRFFG